MVSGMLLRLTALSTQRGGVDTKSGELFRWAREPKISTFAVCDIFAVLMLSQTSLRCTSVKGASA
jgi:hypothetical protein